MGVVEAWNSVWGVVGILVLALFVNEGGVDAFRSLRRSIVYRHRPRPDYRALAEAYRGAEWPRRYFREFWARVKVDWAPFVEWWQRPVDGEFVRIDAGGLRIHDHVPTAAGKRVYVFGGSTTMGVGVRSHATVPALLEARLAAAGHAAEVTNFGQLGHTSSQEMISLIRRLKEGDVPDLAVFYDGTNEVIPAEESGMPDRLFKEDHRRCEFNLLHGDRRGDLLRAAVVSLLRRTLRQFRKLTGVRVTGPFPAGATRHVFADALPALCDEVARRYFENVRIIRLLAREYGFAVLFFWQPVLFTRRHMSPHKTRYLNDAAPDPALRTRLFVETSDAWRRRQAAMAGPDLVDIGRLFDDDPEPRYIDPFHLAEEGNDLVAEAMLPHVVAALRGQP